MNTLTNTIRDLITAFFACDLAPRIVTFEVPFYQSKAAVSLQITRDGDRVRYTTGHTKSIWDNRIVWDDCPTTTVAVAIEEMVEHLTRMYDRSDLSQKLDPVTLARPTVSEPLFDQEKAVKVLKGMVEAYQGIEALGRLWTVRHGYTTSTYTHTGKYGQKSTITTSMEGWPTVDGVAFRLWPMEDIEELNDAPAVVQAAFMALLDGGEVPSFIPLWDEEAHAMTALPVRELSAEDQALLRTMDAREIQHELGLTGISIKFGAEHGCGCDNRGLRFDRWVEADGRASVTLDQTSYKEGDCIRCQM